MSPSKAAHRAAASEAGRGAAQRQLAGGEAGWTGRGDPLDVYLQGMARWKREVGYTVEGKRKRCLWCARATGLRTGSLPYVGDLLFCAGCAATYRTCKERVAHLDVSEVGLETKVHLRDGWGASSCGVGSRTTELMRDVTCGRCRAWYGTNSLGRSILEFLSGGGK